MSIVFDQIDGVIQPETGETRAPSAPEGAQPEAPELDIERIVRELLSAERRRARLSVD